MENLDKTMFASSNEDLQKIYDEEVTKLQENEFKLSLLRKLSIEDFPRDLPDASKQNIEKALIAIRIKNHITLENGQKLLGLEDFDTKRINLNYLEKKLIRGQFEQLINHEKKKQSQAPKDLTEEINKVQENFIELHKHNTELTLQLLELKKQELELLREVAKEMVSPTQSKIVQSILDDAKIVMLQAKTMNQVIIESEMNRSQHYKKALAEISSCVDEQLRLKESRTKK